MRFSVLLRSSSVWRSPVCHRNRTCQHTQRSLLPIHHYDSSRVSIHSAACYRLTRTRRWWHRVPPLQKGCSTPSGSSNQQNAGGAVVSFTSRKHHVRNLFRPEAIACLLRQIRQAFRVHRLHDDGGDDRDEDRVCARARVTLPNRKCARVRKIRYCWMGYICLIVCLFLKGGGSRWKKN